MREHCTDSRARGCEIGGLLVGYREQSRVSIKARGGRKYHLVVTNAVPMSSLNSSSVSWSISEDEWLRVEEKLRAVYAPSGKVRLGWYHTHPNQGIFFSTHDRKAHELFDAPYEFALVIDPRNMEAGLFRWTWDKERAVTGPVSFSLANRGKLNL
jgi:proteasome lid subunit RPN8/RPN11